MVRSEILSWLRETGRRRLSSLWQRANNVRRTRMGNRVHLRGLLEISNHCTRRCAYCGLRRPNRRLRRYRMTASEIQACAVHAVRCGFGTVVLQGGEDPGIGREWLAGVIASIKRATPLAVTLGMGERSPDDLEAWRRAGADRYLLRFETSHPDLLAHYRPDAPADAPDRPALLAILRALGYETGSGMLVGLPGQTWEMLADDLMLLRDLDVDMIGVGPFIPHPGTPLGRAPTKRMAPKDQQVPADGLTTCKVMALARILCPDTNIPATTALATLDPVHGYELGLGRGANVIMPNVTPMKYRRLYEIYPDKVCCTEQDPNHEKLAWRVLSMGRSIAAGRGDSRSYLARQEESRSRQESTG